MTDTSIRKDKIGNLQLNDDVVVDCVLSDCLDKQEGGEVSGSVSIVQHDLNVLSGNYIQTSIPDHITNYACKNAFIQADIDPHYGDSYAGSKAFCVIGLISATN